MPLYCTGSEGGGQVEHNSRLKFHKACFGPLFCRRRIRGRCCHDGNKQTFLRSKVYKAKSAALHVYLKANGRGATCLRLLLETR